MLTSITYIMTKHCQVERRERIERMERDLGFGEIICTTIYRGTRNCLTSTGILLILDEKENILITAYPVKWKIAFKMFYISTGNPPPEYYSEVVRKATYWDMKNHWKQLLTNYKKYVIIIIEKIKKEIEKMKKHDFDKRVLKMTPEELQEHIRFRRMGSVVPNKKGKGSYNRKKSKKVGDE